VLGSERLTGATHDRLTHRCRIIETKGESYRLQDAKTRTRRPKSDDGLSAISPARAVQWDRRLQTWDFGRVTATAKLRLHAPPSNGGSPAL